MAPIYLATTVPGNANASPLFSLKGVKNQAPAALGSLAVTGVPHFREIAYDAYRANIDSFIAATMLGEKVYCVLDGYGSLESVGSLPLPEPPVAFALSKPISEEQENKFLTKLGAGATKEKVGKVTVFHANKPSAELLNNILVLHNPSFNFGKDRVNPRGLQALRLLSGYIMEFCRVNTYPAKSTKLVDEGKGCFITGDYGGEPNMEYYTKEANSESYQNLEKYASAFRLKKRLMAESTEMEVELTDEEKDFYGQIGDLEGAYSSSMHDAVFVAKPSPFPLGTNIVNANSIPEISGIAFPYFDGLCIPDSGVLKSSLATFFLRLLGSNIDQVKSRLMELRRGVQSLATTGYGLALTHMLTGIRLCLETQSRLQLLISDDVYQGFVLLGEGFSIFDGAKWVTPVPSDTFRKDIAFMDPHQKAVEEIVDFFGAMRMSGGFPEGEALPGVQEVNDLEKLQEYLGKLTLKETGDNAEKNEKDINRFLRALSLRGKGYLALNPQNVFDSLVLLFDMSIDVPLERPTFIPEYNAPLHSRPFRILSRFGPDAPSFWDTKGQEYPLKASEKAAEPNEKGKRKAAEKDELGLMPENFLIFPKPLMVAYKDLQMVLEKGAVKFNLKERAKPHRSITLKEKEMVKKFWGLLVGSLEELGGAPAAKKGKKKDVPVSADFDDVLGNMLK